jgi:dihydrofolate reductase
VISSDVAAELAKLKQQPGKTNSVGAGGTLVRFLLTEGLLDELNLLAHPVVVGTGMRLFDEVTRQVDLTLIEACTFSTGVLAVSYQPASRKTMAIATPRMGQLLPSHETVRPGPA